MLRRTGMKPIDEPTKPYNLDVFKLEDIESFLKRKKSSSSPSPIDQIGYSFFKMCPSSWPFVLKLMNRRREEIMSKEIPRMSIRDLRYRIYPFPCTACRKSQTGESDKYCWSELYDPRSATIQTQCVLCDSFLLFGRYSQSLGVALHQARRSISLSQLPRRGNLEHN